MSAIRQILLTHRLLPEQFIRLDPELFLLLEELAYRQERPVRDLVIEVLYATARAEFARDSTDARWQELTPRQQEVAALVCLGLTNHEIAAQLYISVNTVRSHVRLILEKYRISSKTELRLALAHWNFEEWLEGG